MGHDELDDEVCFGQLRGNIVGIQYYRGTVSTGCRDFFFTILGIQDICHFTSRDIGYYPFYFNGYGILGSIFLLLPGILKI